MNALVFYKKYGIFLILLLVVAFFAVFASNFLSIDNLLNVLRQVSMFGIVVVGVTFVMIGGGADLSVGGQMAVSGMVAGILMAKAGMPILPTMLICMALTTLFGALNGLISVKLNIFSMIVTLGTMLILQGLAFVITGGYPIFGLPKDFTFLGQGYVGIVPVPVILFVIVSAIAWFVLSKTYFGRYVYAMGGNPEAARLAGVNVERMRVALFAICSFVTSIASLIMLSRTNSAQPSAGASYPFDCMTAAVLGGISFAGGEGTIGGAVVGVLIIGVLNNGLLLMGVDSNWQGVIKGIVLVTAVGIDSVQRKAKRVKAAEA
jgi:ribose transport system permease protein